MPLEEIKRLQVDGKFFRSSGDGSERVFLKMVTYGPFPDPRPDSVADDAMEMMRIASAGFNAVRLYDAPSPRLLDAARDAGLWVFAGLKWQSCCDFISNPSVYSAARLNLAEGLGVWGDHPALAGVFVANEIPVDMVRWMGLQNVRAAIEELIAIGKKQCPQLLFAYASFPTTEFLEPDNADFTAMNVFLEERNKFSAYLPRLHNVSGDRPVIVSEFGLDTQRSSESEQSDVFEWCLQECLLTGMAGVTAYAWSDWWFQNRVMDEWSFGVTDRSGKAKPALDALSTVLPETRSPEHGLDVADGPMFSVVVCTHNGARRMDACLRAACAMSYANYEVIVVDDGSDDDLAAVVGKYHGVRLLCTEHVGLSAARNLGAKEAKGEIIAYTDDDCEPDAAWLTWLAYSFSTYNWDACGGPNLPPIPDDKEDVHEAVVACAPGAPSHVLLGDIEAEHLPGCNLVVKKKVLERIGGFSVQYRVAGDDVDLCWRLRDEGYKLGFCGAAFVWHRRRTSIWRYFKQQYGYGKAEAMLMRDYPKRFVRGGGARWKGRVYAGGAMAADSGAVIYHGLMATAGYQQLCTNMQPTRPLPVGFDHLGAKFWLGVAALVQPRVRSFARWRYSLRWRGRVRKASRKRECMLIDRMERINDYEAQWWYGGGKLHRLQILDAIRGCGWQALENDTNWDLVNESMRILVACEFHIEGVLVRTRVEMGERSKGQLPADLVKALEALGLVRM